MNDKTVSNKVNKSQCKVSRDHCNACHFHLSGLIHCVTARVTQCGHHFEAPKCAEGNFIMALNGPSLLYQSRRKTHTHTIIFMTASI